MTQGDKYIDKYQYMKMMPMFYSAPAREKERKPPSPCGRIYETEEKTLILFFVEGCHLLFLCKLMSAELCYE